MRRTTDVRGNPPPLEINDKKIPIGILDVDGNLLNINVDAKTYSPTKSKSFILNEALIDTYKELGIKEIYLFTNMSLATLDDEFREGGIPMKRAELIQNLEDRGFSVLGVITPQDIGYGKGLGEVYKDFYKPQYERLLNGEIRPGEGMEDKDFKKAYDQERAYKNAAGQSALQLGTELNYPAPIEGDFHSAFNIKGGLYNYLMENKPEWVSCIVYSDDERSCLNSVKHVADAKSATMPLALIEVPPKTEGPFEKKKYEEMKARYTQQVATQLSNNPLFRQDPHFGQYLALTDAVKSLRQLPKSYMKLGGRHKFKKDIEALVEDVNHKLNTRGGRETKLLEIVKELKEIYYIREKEFKTKSKQQNKILSGRLFCASPRTFIQELNANQNNHHFARMVGLTLQNIYNNPETSETVKQEIGGELGVKCPENKVAYELFRAQAQLARTKEEAPIMSPGSSSP